MPATRTPRLRRLVVGIVLALLLVGATPSASFADAYDERDGGHPLRFIAYVLHPVGVVLDRLIVRPFHWIGHQEPFQTLFGHED